MMVQTIADVIRYCIIVNKIRVMESVEMGEGFYNVDMEEERLLAI